MQELTQTVPSIPAGQSASDAATLRALIADLNNPNSTGVITMPVLTPEQEAQSARVMATEFAKAQSVECIPHEAQVAAMRKLPEPEPQPEQEPVQRMDKVFLTGLPGTGIFELLKGADVHVLNLRELVNNTLKTTCTLNGNPPAGVVTEFRKFGDGEYVPNLSNILMLGLIRRQAQDFGTPGYWVRTAIVAAAHAIDGKPLVIVGVRTTAEFKQLQEAGFAHFHAMCAPATAQRRADPNETVSQLAPALEADVHKKISMQRQGPRMNVVWTDSAPPPVQRFYSIKDFQQYVVGFDAPVGESSLVSQTL